MVLTILCIIALLPAIYPLSLFVKRKDVNLFDLLLLFHTLNFVITPLNYGRKFNFADDIVFAEFLYYISFPLFILFISAYWHRRRNSELNIINITKFIGQYKELKYSPKGRALLALALVVSLTFYLPRATYILHLEEEMGVEIDYQTKSLVALWGSIWGIMGVLFSMNLIFFYKNRRYNKVDLIMSISYFIMLLFFPRRVFLFGMLFLFIALYSIYRDAITKRLIGMSIGFGIAFYLIYFPFYNVMRTSGFIFDAQHPVESLVEIVSNAIDNWNYRDTDEKSAAASSNRSMGLYVAVYNLIKADPAPRYGELTAMSIDVAIPKVFNPNKGDGPEYELEKMAKQSNDQADSCLLHAYGEFHYLGFILAGLLFLFIFSLYNWYGRLWNKYTNSKIIQLYISYLMISAVWSVEGSINGHFSWFFSSIAILILLLVLERTKIVQLS